MEEVPQKVREALQDFEASALSRLDVFVFQTPRAGIRNVDRTESHVERRIHVGARAVANHPARFELDVVPLDQFLVVRGRLLSCHLHVVEVQRRAAPLNFIALLLMLTLRE